MNMDSENVCDKEKGMLRQKESRQKYTTARVTVVILVVINVLLLISLLVMVIHWRQMRFSYLEPVEDTICQSCADIGIDTDEIPESLKGKVSREKNKDTGECCGKASVMIDWMVERAVEKNQYDYSGAMSPLVSDMCHKKLPVVPSAQINGLSELQLREMHTIIHWNHSEDAFFHGGIHYKHGKMIVTNPGFYYIFSQIKLKVTPTIEENETDQTFYNDLEDNNTVLHHIYRHSPSTGDHGVILESAKSRCEYPSSTDGMTTNFMGAVFRLEKDDELHVYTSHPENLVHSKEANFFGLYMT